MAITTVACPLPGTFYRRPAPDQPPFKGEGDAVSVGDTLGLVEVMKSFTPVTAEIAGTIKQFHVEDEDAVMAGQPLLDIET
ncbi:acetyl-CoA carboxylase [Lichenifustis flavocetrariae]|uniref:Biotin carboxyl carrier protein of acetyl-CoA carboxylase n=1 Tax=Lichenifustis flavocetrariae TaxID=2949735 RepID=A0AA42CIF1_9HYPH|nr:acetyl-CoA carboxylase [Lichenifustis flavocetrariae]MCW6508299.1 acetyl-CoA carboxylase [Lichenifustis flavocetrariae]